MEFNMMKLMKVMRYTSSSIKLYSAVAEIPGLKRYTRWLTHSCWLLLDGILVYRVYFTSRSKPSEKLLKTKKLQ